MELTRVSALVQLFFFANRVCNFIFTFHNTNDFCPTTALQNPPLVGREQRGLLFVLLLESTQSPHHAPLGKENK